MNARATLAASTLLLAVLSAAPASAAMVISEFRTRGPAGGNDEFVEIWNNTANPTDISGWKLNGSNNSGTVSTRATVPAGVTVPPGCYYLFTNSGAYSGATAGDQTYGTGFTDTGGLALLLADDTIVDQVGMDNGSAYKEGTVLAPTGSNNDQSYERKPGGINGNGIDTDDNANDFLFNAASSNPSNSGSNCLSATVTHESTWGKIKSIYR